MTSVNKSSSCLVMPCRPCWVAFMVYPAHPFCVIRNDSWRIPQDHSVLEVNKRPGELILQYSNAICSFFDQFSTCFWLTLCVHSRLPIHLPPTVHLNWDTEWQPLQILLGPRRCLGLPFPSWGHTACPSSQCSMRIWLSYPKRSSMIVRSETLSPTCFPPY